MPSDYEVVIGHYPDGSTTILKGRELLERSVRDKASIDVHVTNVYLDERGVPKAEAGKPYDGGHRTRLN